MSSPQTSYGKEVADMIKDDPENIAVAHITKYGLRDEGFIVDISDVPVMMFPDTLEMSDPPKFREYKTGVEPWTQKKVDTSMQLKLYSLGITLVYGTVDDVTHLDWLPTVLEDHKNSLIINGKPYVSTIQFPRMTGEVVTFKTVIDDSERFRAKQWIVQAAHEISADYQKFLQEPKLQ